MIQKNKPAKPIVKSELFLGEIKNSNSEQEKSVLQKLLQKEISQRASELQIQDQELQTWFKLQANAPIQSLLHLIRTANLYDLDPLQEELVLTQYLQGWQVSISIDGWLKIINRHPHFAGIAFKESPQTRDELPVWMECTISRTDRSIPTTVREYFSEVQQDGELWKKMPRRMLHHRTLQQCARIAMAINPSDVNERSKRNIAPIENRINPSEKEAESDTLKLSQSEKLKELIKGST
jgi:RecT family